MASNSIGKASLTLTTDSAELSTGLNKAEGEIKNFQKKQEKVKGGEGGGMLAGFAGLGGLVTVVGSIVSAVGSMTAAFTASAESMLKAKKASADMGVGLKSFSALSYAAKVSGVGVDDLSAGLAAMRANINSADGPANRVFNKIGLSVEQLRGMGEIEAFNAIGVGLKGIEDPLERQAIKLQALGERANELNPMLAKAGSGLTALTDEAIKTGVAFDELSAAKVNEARESLARLGAGWEGMKTSAVTTFAPVVEGIATTISAWKNYRPAVDGASAANAGFGESADSLASKMGTGLQKSLAYTLDGITAYQGVWHTYVHAPALEALGVATDAVVNLGEIFSDVGGMIADETMPYINSAIEGVGGYLDEAASWFDGWGEQIASFSTAAYDAITQSFRTALDAVGIDAQKFFDSVNEWVQWIKGVFGKIGEAFGAIFKKTKAGDAVRGMAKDVEQRGKDMMEQFGKTAEEVDKALDKIEKKSKSVSESIKKDNPISAMTTEMLKSINAMEAELRISIKTVGMTAAEKKMAEFKEKGLGDKPMAELKELNDLAKATDAAFGLIQLPATDLFERQIKGLDALLENGRLTMDQYLLGVNNAAKGLASAAGLAETKTVGANVKDSQSAVSSIIRNELVDKQQDPAAEMQRAMNELANVNKKQLEVAQKQLDFLRNREEIEVEAQ
jgi:hypothetical protein